LDKLVVDALLAEDTRPRTTAIGEGLLVSLRGVNLTPGADPEDMVSIRIWIEKELVVTSRKRSLLSVDDVVSQLESGRGPKSTAELLVELSDRLVWRMSDTVDQFEDRVADLETRSLDGRDSNLRRGLSDLRREAIAVRRYLAPQREALNRLPMEKIEWISDADRMNIRAVTDSLIRNIEDLDALRERASVTQEELTNRIAEQMNTRMYVLSIVAAIFLPLGALTGLLGVNVGGIPGTDYPLAFGVFVLFLLAVVAAQIIWFRRKKWF
jgi:zinc transporter